MKYNRLLVRGVRDGKSRNFTRPGVGGILQPQMQNHRIWEQIKLNFTLNSISNILQLDVFNIDLQDEL